MKLVRNLRFALLAAAAVAFFHTSAWAATKPQPAAVPVVPMEVLLAAPDLRPLVLDAKLSEGWNPIYDSPSGLQISTRVENGRIVDWKACDALGTRLEPLRFQFSENTAVTSLPRRCWHCYDTGGTLDCFEIACPF